MSVCPLQSSAHNELSFVPHTLVLPQLYPVEKPARVRDMGLLPVKDCGNGSEELWVSTRSRFPLELPLTLVDLLCFHPNLPQAFKDISAIISKIKCTLVSISTSVNASKDRQRCDNITSSTSSSDPSWDFIAAYQMSLKVIFFL